MKIISYKKRKINKNLPVRIYRNLNKKGPFPIYSIKQGNKVVGHTDSICLKNCKFIINKAGKYKAVKTGKRNVHAYIEGTLTERESIKNKFSHLLYYFPFSIKGFFIELGQITEAEIVYTEENYLYCQI